jgi:hypothetical protein
MTGSDIITAVFGAANKYTEDGRKARASMFAAMRKLMETEGQMFVCRDYDELEKMAREHLDIFTRAEGLEDEIELRWMLEYDRHQLLGNFASLEEARAFHANEHTTAVAVIELASAVRRHSLSDAVAK